MLAKRTTKNQITLPKRIADQFPRAEYFEVSTEGGRIVLRPVEVDPLSRVQEKLQEIGIEEADIHAAVEWARKTSE